MRTSRKITLLLLVLVSSLVATADPIEEGKTLFMSRCAACHNVNQQLTGPALAGVDQRRSMEWIINFVRSSQSVVKSGDKDAVALYEKFNKIPMPDHADLTGDDVKKIVEYIKKESKPTSETKAPFAKPGKIKSNARPIGISNYAIFGIYFALVAALIGTLLFAVYVNSMKRKFYANH